VLKELREYFQRCRHAYNRRKFYELIVREAGVREGDTVLDVGCGESPLSWKPRNYKIVGLDILESVLKKAKKKSKGDVEFVRANSQSIPFGSETFDAVICIDNYSVPQDSLREMIRVVKHGKKVIISESEDELRKIAEKIEDYGFEYRSTKFGNYISIKK